MQPMIQMLRHQLSEEQFHSSCQHHKKNRKRRQQWRPGLSLHPNQRWFRTRQHPADHRRLSHRNNHLVHCLLVHQEIHLK